MNMNTSDYLADLNLDFEVSPTMTDSVGSSDLDLFAQADFFDLDVFSKSAPLEQKKPSVVKQEDYDFLIPHNDNLSSYNTTPSTQLDQYQTPVPITSVGAVGQLPVIAPVSNYQVTEEPIIDYSPEEISQATTQLSSQVSKEDKRKRNTAALARFRIKKKLKEQEMEQRARQLQENVATLEKRLKTLETENRCLKNLILQQNERKNNDLLNDIKKRSASNELSTGISTGTQFQFTI